MKKVSLNARYHSLWNDKEVIVNEEHYKENCSCGSLYRMISS